MHAICIHEHGGPEALRYEEVSTSEPGAGEARGTYRSRRD